MLTKVSTMIVKINVFSVCIISLQSVLRMELWVISFIHMSVAVVKWKSQTPFLSKCKAMKLKIVAFSIFKISFNLLYQRIYEPIHCVKSIQIRSYFWSEYRKIRTTNNSIFGHFSRSDSFLEQSVDNLS